MIKLYDYDLSGSCYKVRLLLHFLNVQYEKIPVNFVEGEHKSEPFLTINPFGELPVLQDGDLKLRDAQATLVYLALKYDTSNSWYPNDPNQRGLISQWLATGGGELMCVSGARLAKALRYPLDVKKLHEGAHRVFRILNAHLAKREFLELDHPTIGDIACFPYTVLANEAGLDVSGYPHLLAWSLRMRRLPGFLPMPGVSALN
jgi:glutathione S-transferase